MIIRGTLVVTEQVNQKTISLVNDEEGYVSELKSFRDKFKKEEEMLKMQEATIKELTAEDEQNLIEMSS